MLSKLTPITTSIASSARDVAWPEFTPADWRTLAVCAAFVVLFALEARRAYRKHAPASIRQSYFTNLGSFVLNDALMSLLSVSSLWFVAERYAGQGLLNGISHPVAKALGSFLLLDLVLYGWHRINHQVDALWHLHKVHHSDRCMNVTTAFRLHGGEIVLTTLVKAAFIVLAGIDSAVLLSNEALITLFVMFHHTNITFHGERRLGRLIVVPYLHRIHHSAKRSEHDHNYGAVFSFWDRLFGTFTAREPETLGLQQVPGQDLLDLVKFGLNWTLPPQPQRLQAMIAEAAYFRAERRGFAPGEEFADWLEAEMEILGAAHPSIDWTMLPARLLRRVQGTVRATASSLRSGLPAECTAIRPVVKAIIDSVARPLGPGGKRWSGLTIARLCPQD